jgi:shikimate dehydrogenase
VVVGLAELGVQRITVAARNAEKAAPLLEIGTELGVTTKWTAHGSPAADVDVVVNTVPAEVAAQHVDTLASTPLLLDAIYEPWPTPLAIAVEANGGRVISGLQMLLNQAFAQVEQFTGMPAPKEAMRAVLSGL